MGRLWGRVAVGDKNECWPWTGRKLPDGYGRLTIRNRKWLAHRLAWTLTFGDIPAGLDVCHKCDNPGCCNPDHLFLGTHLDNMRDKVAKGRASALMGEDCPTAKLTNAAVIEIRRLRAEGWTLIRLGERFNTHLSNISLICRGKAWPHVEAA